ncbi:hypothetical protein R4Z09_03200 [Niallia oryzisoli]|uniref:Uncharacterized protein n=1 Tax=Niallia oryzisoli TaxID=1737571 RepID=A0ABZ2CJT0_9BACI
MSILAINTRNNEKQLRKTIWAYLILSAAMTWMFLYPLLGGVLFYFIVRKLFSHITYFVGCRVFLNTHNSGIATLTLASLLKGVFEIAGTNSTHLVFYNVAGWAFIAVGLIIMIIMATHQKDLSNDFA